MRDYSKLYEKKYMPKKTKKTGWQAVACLLIAGFVIWLCER